MLDRLGDGDGRVEKEEKRCLLDISEEKNGEVDIFSIPCSISGLQAATSWKATYYIHTQNCSKTDLNKGSNDCLKSRQGRRVRPGKSRQGDDQQVKKCDQLLPLQALTMASWPRGGEWGQGEGFRSPLAVLEDHAHQLRR